MCSKDFENKVRECGATYGMDIYSDNELLSLATGVNPEKFTGSFREILDCPSIVRGIGRRKELAVFAVKELARRLMREESRKIEIVHGPEDAAHFAMPYFQGEHKQKNEPPNPDSASMGYLRGAACYEKGGHEDA